MRMIGWRRRSRWRAWRTSRRRLPWLFGFVSVVIRERTVSHALLAAEVEVESLGEAVLAEAWERLNSAVEKPPFSQVA
jgi:hypothetical protein